MYHGLVYDSCMTKDGSATVLSFIETTIVQAAFISPMPLPLEQLKLDLLLRPQSGPMAAIRRNYARLTDYNAPSGRPVWTILEQPFSIGPGPGCHLVIPGAIVPRQFMSKSSCSIERNSVSV